MNTAIRGLLIGLAISAPVLGRRHLLPDLEPLTMTTQTAASEVAYSHSPEANLVLTAAATLDGRLPFTIGLPDHIDRPLAELLQNIGDAMHDDHAIEREHPENIPSKRWLVHPGWDDAADREHWTDALRLARAILGRPDPNTPAEVA